MKSPLWSVVFMLLISVVCAGVLETIRMTTQDRVAQNERLALQREVLSAFGLLEPEAGPDRVQELFNASIRTEQRSGREYWQVTTGDRAGSQAFAIQGMGFWAPIHAILAIERDGRTIGGIRFYKHGETPGLGGRISESWFMAQFKGKRLGSGEKLRLVMPGSVKGENDVDAITGATQTSRKVEHLLNHQAIEALGVAGP